MEKWIPKIHLKSENFRIVDQIEKQTWNNCIGLGYDEM